MPLTAASALIVAKALMGEPITPFTLENTYLGIGNGSSAFDRTQVGLQGLEQLIKPTAHAYRTGAALNYKATFGPLEAVFVWNEWALFNGNPGDMLTRVAETFGVKPDDESWVLDITIEIV